jgi:hypothetical protein
MLRYQNFESTWLKLFFSISIVILMISPAFPIVTISDDLTGTWNAEIDTQIGILKYSYIIKQEGTQLTGTIISTIEGEKRETALLEGKFIDGIITFVEIMKFEDNEIRISYKGELEGGEIKFTREVGEFATESFVAKRAKSEAGNPSK